MASKTFWLRDLVASASLFGDIRENPEAIDVQSITGWTVAKTAPTVYASMSYGTEVAETGFVSGIRPIANYLNNTAANAFRTSAPETSGSYTGSFAAGNWHFTQSFAGSTSAGADGTFTLRLYKSANADGTSATEITTTAVSGSIITDILQGVPNMSYLTLNLGQIDLDNEYLFFAYGWKITGASSKNNGDTNFWMTSSANNYNILTTDWTEKFVPPAPPEITSKTYLLMVG